MITTNMMLCIALLLIIPQCLLASSFRSKKEAFDGLKEFGPTLSHRQPPPLVRRDVVSRVKYDLEKWISEPQMTISGAVMFDRETGLTVEQCLEKCAKPQYQNAETRWICRSLVYDHKWHICDLFAVIGSTPPYFLSEYKHRDYFQYLAALPPMDKEFKPNASREMSAEVQAEEKKFESTTTTTTTTSSPWFLKDSDVLTTPPPSGLIELTEPVVVKASKQKFENGFVDSSKSKEEGVKVFASKQTGDSHVLEHKAHETLKSTSSKIEYHRKPSLKFAITPIKKDGAEEEPKSSFEQATTVSSKETTFESTPDLTSTTASSKETTFGSSVSETPFGSSVSETTFGSSVSETTFGSSASESTFESTSEATTAKTASTEQIEVVASEIPTTVLPQSSTIKNIETYQKSTGFIQIEEEPRTVEVSADVGPIINNVQKIEPKTLKRKIQGITTYAVQNTNNRKAQNSACKANEIARYIRIEKHERIVEADKKVEALQAEDCAEICTTEGEFKCKSAVFQPSTCYLFVDAANHSAPNTLNKNERATYLEQICIPEHLGDRTQLVNDAIYQYILVGQVQEVTDAPTLEKCQIDCLSAVENLGFVCKSAMFYPTDVEAGQNCLLNSESHQTKSDAFVPEDAGVNMIYFIVGGESNDHKKQALAGGFQSLDSPIKKDDSNWTKWSKCRDTADAIRHRYLKCTHQKDIRKCPKQSSFCKPPSLQIHKLSKPEFECRAVRSKGRKLCPHGFRYDSRGIRHYCTHPVDC